MLRSSKVRRDASIVSSSGLLKYDATSKMMALGMEERYDSGNKLAFAGELAMRRVVA